MGIFPLVSRRVLIGLDRWRFDIFICACHNGGGCWTHSPASETFIKCIFRCCIEHGGGHPAGQLKHTAPRLFFMWHIYYGRRIVVPRARVCVCMQSRALLLCAQTLLCPPLSIEFASGRSKYVRTFVDAANVVYFRSFYLFSTYSDDNFKWSLWNQNKTAISVSRIHIQDRRHGDYYRITSLIGEARWKVSEYSFGGELRFMANQMYSSSSLS